MTALTDRANSVYRDSVTAGVPATGPNDPAKSDIRALFALIDAALSSIGAGIAIGNAIVKPDLASLNADLAHADSTLAVVFNDSTPANDGVYVKSGTSGSGSWLKTALTLPGGFYDAVNSSLATKMGKSADSDLDMNGIYRIKNLAVTTQPYDAVPLYQVQTIVDGSAAAAKEDSASTTESWSGHFFGPGAARNKFADAVPYQKLNGLSGTTYSFNPPGPDFNPGYPSVFYTGFVAIRAGGGTLRVSFAVGSYSFYNRYGVWVAGVEAANLAAGATITKPAAAHYFSCDGPLSVYFNNEFQGAVITEFDTLPIIQRAAGFPLITAYTGKRIGFLSDSELDRSTPNYVTQTAICQDLGAIDTPFTNDAVSGRRWADCLPGGANPALTSANLNALDVLMILLGTNDFANPVRPLGTYADASSVNSTAGVIRNVFETIFTLRPKGLEVRALLPAKRFQSSLISGSFGWDAANSVGNKLIEYVELERQILGDFGVKYLSLFHDWPVNNVNHGQFMDDGVHATTAYGQRHMAYTVANWLRGV